MQHQPSPYWARIAIPCEHCGAHFWVSLSASTRKFCSRACYLAHLLAARGGAAAMPPPLTRTCERCGAPFRTYANRLRQHDGRGGRYCSLRCANRGRSRPDEATRLWARCDRSDPDGCWEWQSTRYPGGYGRFYGDAGPERAHRAAYRLTFGPIPPGRLVCHHCDNRACINPHHLFLGTHRENMADMDAKGRRPTGANGGVRTALSAEQFAEVKALLAEGHSQRSLAKRFGVSPTYITVRLRRAGAPRPRAG